MPTIHSVEVPDELLSAFTFFFEWEGGGINTVKAHNALQMAEAEVWGANRGDIEVCWEADNDFDFDNAFDDPYIREETRKKLKSGEWEVLGCVIKYSDEASAGYGDDYITAVWGITLAPNNGDYKRAVAAELLSQAWCVVGDEPNKPAYLAQLLANLGTETDLTRLIRTTRDLLADLAGYSTASEGFNPDANPFRTFSHEDGLERAAALRAFGDRAAVLLGGGQ